MDLDTGAYLISGGSETVPHLLALLEGEGIRTIANPDMYIREYLHFGIEDARELRRRASSRAVREKHRVFIIVTSGMTVEAQNALLKTLEEPSADARFFIIVPSPETLLPTLRSRAQIVLLSDSVEKGAVDAGGFLAATPRVRIEMLKSLLPKEKEERDVGAIIVFLSSLEKELGKAGAEKAKAGLEAIYRARKYIADDGSLLKPLLEQVALLVPRQ
ncbi:MAG: hypothetical protein Q7S08_04245 [bacterium]|nr:hypothetical protein [bacterium]